VSLDSLVDRSFGHRRDHDLDRLSSVCAPLLPTVSISHAVLSMSSRACSILPVDSAIQPWMTPCSASGFPNAVRVAARVP
jgi:hypothetical protein